eukprot:gene17898-24290_t
MSVINKYWPHPGHLLINNGLAAATCRTFALGVCFELNLPKQADMIIMEQHVSRDESNKDMDHLSSVSHNLSTYPSP